MSQLLSGHKNFVSFLCFFFHSVIYNSTRYKFWMQTAYFQISFLNSWKQFEKGRKW